MKKYPEIEKANSMLRRLAMMGFCDRYEGEEHASLAMHQLVEELIAVERDNWSTSPRLWHKMPK